MQNERNQSLSGGHAALRVNLIGKGHRHRDTTQTKYVIRSYQEVAEAFEVITFANQWKLPELLYRNIVLNFVWADRISKSKWEAHYVFMLLVSQ